MSLFSISIGEGQGSLVPLGSPSSVVNLEFKLSRALGRVTWDGPPFGGVESGDGYSLYLGEGLRDLGLGELSLVSCLLGILTLFGKGCGVSGL